MTTLITGAAGFIGFHTAQAMLSRGEPVLGIDNLNDYYSPDLKRQRLGRLMNEKGFEFVQADLADEAALRAAVEGRGVARIIHLAAQAGVRHSIDNPAAYARSNLVGHLNMLELARHTPGLEIMCYASSSSVYGGRTDLPFRETDRVDRPVSLYAATKCADELMSHTYAHLYAIPLVGLRFFTVYGPWGRPDMAYWSFTQDIIAGREIKVFNNGDMLRDFTYVDDIVDGIVRIATTGLVGERDVPHAIYNIGNNRPERLDDLISTIERLTGRTARRRNMPMQPGDVPATYADITAIRGDYGFEPRTDLASGLARFVTWYRQHYRV